MIDISIIVLSYNSSFQQIFLTLKSILLQKNASFEIILADDGSKEYPIEEIIHYFQQYNFTRYIYIKDRKNLGTVKNILRALDYSNGKYIKCIGAGDLLYDKDVLNNVIKKMNSENIKFLFTDLVSYRMVNDSFIADSFKAPVIKKPYMKKDLQKIQKNISVNLDYISGATMFFEKELLLKYLKLIKGIVIYQEDILQVLAVLEGVIPVYMNIYGILYEMGSGISTQWSIGALKNKMWVDTINFWEYVFDKYKNNYLVQKRKKHVNIIKQHGEIIRFLVHFFENPKISIRSFERKHFRRNIQANLGFLDDPEFVEKGH